MEQLYFLPTKNLQYNVKNITCDDNHYIEFLFAFIYFLMAANVSLRMIFIILLIATDDHYKEFFVLVV